MTCVPFRVDGVDKRAKGICSEHVSRYWAEICAAEGCSRLIDTGGWPDRLSSSLLDALSKSEADIEVHGSLCRGMASPPTVWRPAEGVRSFRFRFPLFIPAAYIDRSSNWVDWGVFWWTKRGMGET